MASRYISVNLEMLDLMREIPCCMATGETVGVAASLAIKNNEKSIDIDVEKLCSLIS